MTSRRNAMTRRTLIELLGEDEIRVELPIGVTAFYRRK